MFDHKHQHEGKDEEGVGFVVFVQEEAIWIRHGKYESELILDTDEAYALAKILTRMIHVILD